MTMSLRTFIITGIVGALFMVALISWSIGVGIQNQANQTLADDVRVNAFFTAAGGNITNIEQVTNNQSAVFTTDNPTIATDTLISKSQPSILKVFSAAFVIGVYDVTIGLVLNLFQVNSLVIATIGIIMGIFIIFAIMRIFKQGE